MEPEFLNLSCGNIASEHLCCIIRSKTKHPGIEAKRQWLCSRLEEGHVFRKLDVKGCCFAEYAPLEKAWVPILGENYLYLYCLWVSGDLKGHGYGRQLMESVIQDAKANGKSGVCMLGAKKQKNWLSDQDFAKKYGFAVADSTDSGYDLLALSFDGTLPRFADSARCGRISSKGLTVFYSPQCPYILPQVEKLHSFCQQENIPAEFILVEDLEQAKAIPGPFNNWAAFWDGQFQTVNLLDAAAVRKLAAKAAKTV